MAYNLIIGLFLSKSKEYSSPRIVLELVAEIHWLDKTMTSRWPGVALVSVEHAS